MKKLIVMAGILVMLLGFIAYPASAIETFILIYDAPGNYEGVQDVKSGLSIAGESLYSFGQAVTLGYGVEVPGHSLKPPELFGFVPAFGVIKVAPFGNSFQMDFSARVGYSFLVGDQAYMNAALTDGGLYYGYGLGYFLNRDKQEGSFTKLELLYSVSNGTRTIGGDDHKLTYSRYSFLISFGYEAL
jgi:hypothetical protein